MKSSEARIGEAEAALRHRLTVLGVEEPAARAHEFITELLREGWRPVAHPVHRPSPGGERRAHADTAAREAAVMREEIREVKAQRDAAKEVTAHEGS